MRTKKIDLHLLTDPRSVRPFCTGVYHYQETREAVATDARNMAISRLPEHFREFGKDTLTSRKGDTRTDIPAISVAGVHAPFNSAWKVGQPFPAPDPERIRKAIQAIRDHRKAEKLRNRYFFLFGGNKEKGPLLEEKALRFLNCLSGRDGEFRIAAMHCWSSPVVCYKEKDLEAIFMGLTIEDRYWISDDVCVL